MMLGLDAKAEGQSAVATARPYLMSLCVANLVCPCVGIAICWDSERRDD